MRKFSVDEVKFLFNATSMFFEKTYPNGASTDDIKKDLSIALNNYKLIFDKNINAGMNRHISACRKARNKCYIYETIENIMKINSLTFTKDLSFCQTDNSNQIALFIKLVDKDSYESYLTVDDLSK